MPVPYEGKCSICYGDIGLDYYDIARTACPGKHLYHAGCIKEALARETNKRCPTCRFFLQQVDQAFTIINSAKAIFAGAFVKTGMVADYRLALLLMDQANLDFENLISVLLSGEQYDWIGFCGQLKLKRLGINIDPSQFKLADLQKHQRSIFFYCIKIYYQLANHNGKHYQIAVQEGIRRLFQKYPISPGKMMHELQKKYVPICMAIKNREKITLAKLLAQLEQQPIENIETWIQSCVPAGSKYNALLKGILNSDITTLNIGATAYESQDMESYWRLITSVTDGTPVEFARTRTGGVLLFVIVLLVFGAFFFLGEQFQAYPAISNYFESCTESVHRNFSNLSTEEVKNLIFTCSSNPMWCRLYNLVAFGVIWLTFLFRAILILVWQFIIVPIGFIMLSSRVCLKLAEAIFLQAEVLINAIRYRNQPPVDILSAFNVAAQR